MDNVSNTMATFPQVCITVGIYVSNMFLDFEFQRDVISLIKTTISPIDNNMIVGENAQWVEYQVSVI